MVGGLRGQLKEYSTNNDRRKRIQCIVFNTNLSATTLRKRFHRNGLHFSQQCDLVRENWLFGMSWLYSESFKDPIIKAFVPFDIPKPPSPILRSVDTNRVGHTVQPELKSGVSNLGNAHIRNRNLCGPPRSVWPLRITRQETRSPPRCGLATRQDANHIFDILQQPAWLMPP